MEHTAKTLCLAALDRSAAPPALVGIIFRAAFIFRCELFISISEVQVIEAFAILFSSDQDSFEKSVTAFIATPRCLLDLSVRITFVGNEPLLFSCLWHKFPPF